jgi:hypothetical protein
VSGKLDVIRFDVTSSSIRRFKLPLNDQIPLITVSRLLKQDLEILSARFGCRDVLTAKFFQFGWHFRVGVYRGTNVIPPEPASVSDFGPPMLGGREAPLWCDAVDHGGDGALIGSESKERVSGRGCGRRRPAGSAAVAARDSLAYDLLKRVC